MIVTISISLFLEFFTFLSIIPINRPVIVSIPPIIIKSKKDQFTSLVNCIAINGIKSNSPTIYKILIIILKRKYNIYIFIPLFLLISSIFVGFFVFYRGCNPIFARNRQNSLIYILRPTLMADEIE